MKWKEMLGHFKPLEKGEVHRKKTKKEVEIG
jgi:hypothetical protein